MTFLENILRVALRDIANWGEPYSFLCPNTHTLVGSVSDQLDSEAFWIQGLKKSYRMFNQHTKIYFSQHYILQFVTSFDDKWYN